MEHEHDSETELKDLSADEILAANDRVIVPVPVPEWGGRVWVRSMTGIERERYITSVRKIVGKGKNATEQTVIEESSARLVQQTCCNANGELLFTAAQIKKLATKSAKALQRVVDKAAELNGLDEDAEEAAKNASAGGDHTDDSSTD